MIGILLSIHKTTETMETKTQPTESYEVSYEHVGTSKIPLDQIFDQHYLAACGFISNNSKGQKWTHITMLCKKYLAVYLDDNRVPHDATLGVFSKIGENMKDLRILLRYRMTEEKGLHTAYYKSFVLPNLHAKATFALNLVYGEQIPQQGSVRINATDAKDDEVRIGKICATVVNILRDGSFKSKIAHHCADPERKRGDRERLSYKFTHHRSLEFAKIRISEFEKEHKFAVSYPRRIKRGRSGSRESKESQILTVGSYIESLKLAREALKISKELTELGTPIPEECRAINLAWEGPVTDEIKRENGGMPPNITYAIIIRSTTRTIRDTFLAESGKDGTMDCFMCEKILIGFNGSRWNLWFVSSRQRKIPADHDLFVRYRAFLDKIEIDAERQKIITPC